jgi:two-component system NtrC family sensor kinase
VAHEINNPLTGILTYASFLMKRTKDQPDIHKDLEVIVRETLRSREIVKGLLDFARQTIPKKVKSDIHQVIERALTVLENQLTLNHIEVEKHFSKQLPQILIDPNQMQQVFTN